MANCPATRPTLMIGEAAEAAGLPPGVLNVVVEGGTEGGELLTTHPAVDCVSFTGSTTVGKAIMAQAAGLAALGIGCGLAGAWGLTRLMASMLYEVKPTDLYTFMTIPLLLGAVVLLAGYIPSRRAMALDPAVALRHE